MSKNQRLKEVVEKDFNRQKLQLQKIKILAEDAIALSFFDHENHRAFSLGLQVSNDGILISAELHPQTKVAPSQLYQLLRKYLQNEFLQEALIQKNEIHFIFEGHKYLMINTLSADLELLVDGKSVLRVVNLKTFTKIKDRTYTLLTEPEIFNISEIPKAELKDVKHQILPVIQRQLRDQLKRKFKTLKKAYSKQLKILTSIAQIEDLKKNIRKLIESQDTTSGHKINELYIELKKLEAGQKLSLAPKILLQLNDLEMDLTESATEHFILDKIPRLRRKWDLQDRAKKTTSAPLVKLPWRTAQLSSGEIFHIGRTSAENDALVKSSKSNDIWFHAIQVQGSHVILKRRQKEYPDAKIIRVGLILAIHFSKLSQTKSGEVYVSTREFLKKRKDDPPGFWHVLKAEHFQIRYTSEELEIILKS